LLDLYLISKFLLCIVAFIPELLLLSIIMLE